MGSGRIGTAVVTILLAAGCHGQQLLMVSAPVGGHYEWRDPVQLARVAQDAVELPVPVDRPVGYAAARQRPLSAFGISARIRWNATVDKLCRCYGELCSEHNSALVSVQEFEERRSRLDEVTQILAQLRPRFLKALDDYDAAQALVAPELSPEERPPGVSPAVARALMEEARARGTRLLEAAAQAVGALGPEPLPVPEDRPAPHA